MGKRNMYGKQKIYTCSQNYWINKEERCFWKFWTLFKSQIQRLDFIHQPQLIWLNGFFGKIEAKLKKNIEFIEMQPWHNSKRTSLNKFKVFWVWLAEALRFYKFLKNIRWWFLFFGGFIILRVIWALIQNSKIALGFW